MTDHGSEVDDVGSLDVGVAAGEMKTKNKKKRKKEKVAVAGVEGEAVDVSKMDVALAEVQYSVSRSESCAESIYGAVVLDQDEDTIQRILIHCFSTRVYHGQVSLNSFIQPLP
ncbi:hypothetical protein BCR33DRAFT_138356 [Rhizoclosmatium globosum]|uniref:Uncharacterized protein n=1 Tax=Rhizoclosmatium globosum TaxID=329046 RepID=A0A1Y2AKR5_9FUNG|nr:hypothetical protein BCR33DRAFT_138356 [Rhizoclosmatium globosum]|eukprot:ORY23084.1 hypothetical protein BCR33DRAFT_138356 [Rhizoclosmatium globosum]